MVFFGIGLESCPFRVMIHVNYYVIEKAQDPREILSRTCWNATENFP